MEMYLCGEVRQILLHDVQQTTQIEMKSSILLQKVQQKYNRNNKTSTAETSTEAQQMHNRSTTEAQQKIVALRTLI